jgi:hypothetical protein
MPESTKPAPGQVAWIDLTVPDADAVRDFYQQVTGWTASSVDMGGYADYCMNSSAGNMVAGICHARGVNAGLPPVWMVYIAVANLDEAMRLSVERGGKIRIPPKNLSGHDRYCVIEDPAGALAALCEAKP